MYPKILLTPCQILVLYIFLQQLFSIEHNCSHIKLAETATSNFYEIFANYQSLVKTLDVKKIVYSLVIVATEKLLSGARESWNLTNFNSLLQC